MSIRSNGALLLLRRAYSSVAIENVKAPAAAASSVMKKVVVEAAAAAATSTSNIDDVQNVGAEGVGMKEAFWMKHPTTGDWVPENHFNEVDVADLRAKFLSSTAPKS